MRLRVVSAIAVFMFCTAAIAADSAKAKQLLREADDLYDEGKFAAAMDRYEAAEKADPASADYDRLWRYSMLKPALVPAEGVKEDPVFMARVGRAAARIAERNPASADAIRLAGSAMEKGAAATEAIAFFDRLLENDPKNHAAAVQLLTLTLRHEKSADARARAFERAAAAASTAEHHYTNGVIAYEYTTKIATGVEGVPAIAQGKESFDRALKAKPDYMEALLYKSLLLKEEAKHVPSDRSAALVREADALREQAMAIVKKRSQAAQGSASE